MARKRAVAAGALAVLAVSVLAACGGSSSSSASSSTSSTTSTTPVTGTAASGGQEASATQSKWLHVDNTKKSAVLVLDAAMGSVNSGFNFDGYAKGQMVVSIPAGWKVTARCTNDSKTVPHSCAIVTKAGSTVPAFTGSATPSPTTGLAPGKSATFSFTPTTPGTYRIDCLVPGHDPAGMWDTLQVTNGGAPSLTTNGSTSAGTSSS